MWTFQIEIPFPWQPEILPIQLLRIGGLVLIGVPAEVTYVFGFPVLKFLLYEHFNIKTYVV